MKHTLISGLFLVTVLFLPVAPSASACMNDREVEAVEQEFKSNYNQKHTPLQVHTEQNHNSSTGYVAMSLGGGGILLMIGGAVLVLLRSKGNR